MPICGLTNRAAEGRMTTIGILRKGAPRPANGKSPGVELPYFRFDTKDDRAAAVFLESYGAEPQEIRVLMPYKTTDQCFPTAKESYVASGLRSRCDGEFVSAMRLENGKIQRQFISPAACPGAKFCESCKPVGRLQCIIPELNRFALVNAETHSVHDIVNLDEQLRAIEATFGRLDSIPLVLRKTQKKISIPRDNGDRQRINKWLLSIEVNPEWAALQLAAARSAQLAAATVYSIGGNVPNVMPRLPASNAMRSAQAPNHRDTNEWVWFEGELAKAIQSGEMGQIEQVVSNAYEWARMAPQFTGLHQAIANEHDRAISASSAVAVEVMPMADVEIYPVASTVNFDRIAALLKLLGTALPQAKLIRQGLLGKKQPKDYSQDEMSQLQDALLIDWAAQFPCWQHDSHRVNSYHKFVEGLDGVPTDEELFTLWKEECEIRVEGETTVEVDSQVDSQDEGFPDVEAG